MQGGAIATIFDVLCATYGSVLKGRFCYEVTKRLEVRYLAPAAPLPGVFRVEVAPAALDERAGALRVAAALFDGDRGRCFARAEADLVDPRVRAAARKRREGRGQSKL